MFGFLSKLKLPSIPNLFDKLIQIVVKIRCRIICCGKDIDHVTIPENCLDHSKDVSFKSIN